MSAKLQIIYCGTPDFSVPTLEALYKHPLVELKAVVCMPDRPAGRGQNLVTPLVAAWAKFNNVRLVQTENINKDSEIQSLLSEGVDAIIVLAFAQFLGSKILSGPRLGCFNIHTSLLPRHRGAAPIQYAILTGDTVTGVSIQKMVKKMDAGDIARSDQISINSDETGESLYNRLKIEAAKSCSSFINDLASGKINYKAQDESQVTFAPTLNKDDGLLDFSNKDFSQLDRQVRALHPWPGTFCYLDNKRLKIFSIAKAFGNLAPSEWSFDQGAFLIGHKSGTLRAMTVQLEGKKACSDIELINGLANSKPSFIINPNKVPEK